MEIWTDKLFYFSIYCLFDLLGANSKAKQFHNLYKAGCASDESVLSRFLVSMKVNRQDLKILRFFTRCARVTTHTQKYSSQVSG